MTRRAASAAKLPDDCLRSAHAVGWISIGMLMRILAFECGIVRRLLLVGIDRGAVAVGGALPRGLRAPSLDGVLAAGGAGAGVLGDQHARSFEGWSIGRLHFTGDFSGRDRGRDRSGLRAVGGLELGGVAHGPAVVVRAVPVRQAVRLAPGPGAAGLSPQVSRALHQYEWKQDSTG